VISVRLDAAGNQYVPDFDNQVIYRVDPSGAPTIVAGTFQKAGYSGDGGLATAALLSGPAGVAPAPDGTLYITEYSNSRIRKVAPNGIITTIAGTTSIGFSGDGGPSVSAQIRNPVDIVVDGAGNILFTDWGNARVRKITPAGIISTVAGFGTRAYSGDGASALQAGMDPAQLAVGPGGSFYVTDSGLAGSRTNNRVRLVASNGIISTVAGNGSAAHSGDGGPATAAGLAGADGVAIDSAGNLYISEFAVNRVRKVSPGGIIITYAGTGGGGATGDGGPALQATLSGPRGLTVDSSNNLYIADQQNRRIRKVSGSPVITSNGVVNGASFAPGGIVPGELATVFGSNLTTGTGLSFATALPLPTQLANVQVIVNGSAVPIFSTANVAGLQQVNFQVPFGLAGQSTATVQVVSNGIAGNTVSVAVLTAQPGIYTYAVGTSLFGAILHANFQLADTAHPATGGEVIQIYCTGLGAVTQTPPDGAATPGIASSNTPTTVTIGGLSAPVSYSGLAPGFVGLYQVNAQVPSGLSAGNQPVVLTAGGISSSIALLPTQ
jgi:uncharacterized protein (TIGR03437 family)